MLWSFVLEGLGLLGAYLVAKKLWWSWLVLSANSCLWITYGWTTGQWGFVVSSTAFFGIYLRNARKWKQTESAQPAVVGVTPSETHVVAAEN